MIIVKLSNPSLSKSLVPLKIIILGAVLMTIIQWVSRWSSSGQFSWPSFSESLVPLNIIILVAVLMTIIKRVSRWSSLGQFSWPQVEGHSWGTQLRDQVEGPSWGTQLRDKDEGPSWDVQVEGPSWDVLTLKVKVQLSWYGPLAWLRLRIRLSQSSIAGLSKGHGSMWTNL